VSISGLLTPLPSRAEDVQAMAASLLDGSRHFWIGEMERRKWVVAPLPDAFTRQQAASLAEAARRRGIESAIALTTEPAVQQEQFLVPMTPEGVLAFDMNCLLRFFLLVPDDASFAVLHEANYYWLLAGERELVAEVLRTPPEEAFNEFMSGYVEGESWPPRTAGMLREIDRYRRLLATPVP
jgi:hypothetical protein